MTEHAAIPWTFEQANAETWPDEYECCDANGEEVFYSNSASPTALDAAHIVRCVNE